MGFEVIGMMLLCQIEAPRMVADVPSFHSLQVTDVWEHPREVTDTYYDRLELSEPEELPRRLIIRGCNKQGGTFTLGIDLERHVIAHAEWNTLLASEYRGSAAIGIALFGVPGLLVTSPFLIALHAAYKLGRMVTGMDRHMSALYWKLAPQVGAAADDLKKALQNHCNGVEEAYFDEKRHAYRQKEREARIAQQFANRKDDICEGAFMVRAEAGTAELNEVLDDVGDWYKRSDADRAVKLSEWLGMTDIEFEDWSRGNKTILQLLEDREKERAQVPANATHQG